MKVLGFYIAIDFEVMMKINCRQKLPKLTNYYIQ